MSTTCLRGTVLRSRHCKQDRARYTRLFGSLVLATSTMALMSCAGYVPGRQAYWDAQVKEMCEKDGGVHIFERITISPAQAERLPKVSGFFGVTPEKLAGVEDPAFLRKRRSQVREGDLLVIREEQEVIRRVDGKVVALVVRYGRGGGDFPSYAHPSTYSCPDYMSIYAGIHRVYSVEEAKK